MTDETPREKVLSLFRQQPDGFVSGAELSRTLGVSRSAVWKQIGLLREAGYVIDAVPSRGYRLTSTPDALLPAEIRADLGCSIVGSEVTCLDETDSTNLRAHDLGEQGAPDGAVVLADRQSAGKGRMGRQWVSPPGVNLYASVLLRPKILPRCAPHLTFLGAVAVARAIEEVSGLETAVKWPNDVLLSGRKVAGMLNEMSAETEGIHYVILGIGVNLNMQSEQFPADLRYPATSIAIELGRPVSRLAFTRALLREIDALYALYLAEGFSPVKQAWQARSPLLGREVEVDCQGRMIRGRVTGLGEDGALLLETAAGTERILAGDVRPLAL